MSSDEERVSLRVTARLEGEEVVVQMTGPAAPENGLQTLGDWVLAALEQRSDGATEAARRMVTALRDRDWVDLKTGEVWPTPAFDYAVEIGQEDEDEDDKWLWVHCEGSRDGYRDMERFIGTVRDPGRADRLEIAITGRGAFRRFRDVLARWPKELERWEMFSTDRQRGRARAWLADAGYYVRRGLPL